MSARGRVVVTAGQIGWDPRTMTIESDDFAAQCAQVFRNIVDVLGAAGASADHLVRLTWYVTSRDEYLASLREVGRAYREIVGRHYPRDGGGHRRRHSSSRGRRWRSRRRQSCRSEPRGSRGARASPARCARALSRHVRNQRRVVTVTPSAGSSRRERHFDADLPPYSSRAPRTARSRLRRDVVSRRRSHGPDGSPALARRPRPSSPPEWYARVAPLAPRSPTIFLT